MSQAKSHRRTTVYQSPLAWLGLHRGTSIKTLVLILAATVSGFSVVLLAHQNRNQFNELQRLREDANGLEVQWGQLMIEQSTFGVEGRIEQKATELLDLHIPEIADIVLITND